jgi:O-antigen ligase
LKEKTNFINILKENYLLVFFILVSFLLSPFTVYPFINNFGIVFKYFFYFSVFIFIKAVISDKLKDSIVKIIVYPSFLVVWIGILQFLNKGFYLRLIPFNFSSGFLPYYLLDLVVMPFKQSHYRVYSLFYAPPMLGVYLSMVIPLTFYIFSSHTGGYKKLFTGVNLLFSLLVLYLSYTRIAWISIFVTLGIFSVYIKNRKIIVYFFSCLILTIILISFLRPEIISLGTERLHTFTDISYYSNLDRIVIWSASWAVIKQHWLTGTGNFSFWLVLPDFRFLWPHTHSYILQLLLENGIVLTVILFAFYFKVIKQAQNELKENNKLQKYAIFCSVLGFFITGIVDYPAYDPRNNFLFWILMAIL